MIKIGIVYFSTTDVTGKLARAVCKEITEHDIPLTSHQIVGAEIVEGRFVNKDLMAKLHSCDAIIFASPTYMGNVSAQFKAFADATSDFWGRSQYENDFTIQRGSIYCCKSKEKRY